MRPAPDRRICAEPRSGFRADVAQLVEHSLGKGEVTSSILVIGSRHWLASGEQQTAGSGRWAGVTQW